MDNRAAFGYEGAVPEVARERQRGRLLLELSRQVTGSLEMQAALDAAFAAMHTLVPFRGGAIQLVEDGFLVAAATDPPATAEALAVRIPVGQGVSGGIAATGEPVYIPDITADERVYPAARKPGVSGGVRSYFGVPLISGGVPIGVLQIDSPEVDAFDADVRDVVLAFAPSVAAAVQNARLFEREQQAVIDLREAQRMQRDFLAVVSHELRTPLTAISGFAETLRAARGGGLSGDDVAAVAQRIERASRRLERLIVDLLDISQLERTSLQVNLQAADLGAVVQGVVDELPSSGHEVRVVVEPDLPPAQADERRVRQVLEHLLDNARKFSPAGSAIEVRLAREGEGVVALSVADEGVGIPPAVRDRVFERFFQVESSSTRPAGGLGVGLYLVQRLCDLMGATVSVDSVVGRGTRFTVHIPVADVAVAR
jgi:signal transduction histidine kinase